MTTVFSTITSTNGGSVAIIRISGEKTVNCLNALGINKKLNHNQILFTKIYDLEHNKLLDEAVISSFEAPNSFTGENVIEINIHNSIFIIKRIFAILSKVEDVAIAEAGEFSKRAFLNGKIDLVQAEAIPDLIRAETEIQHRQALQQLTGTLGQKYENWRSEIIQALSMIEAVIDFPEDDLPTEIIDSVENKVQNLIAGITLHLQNKSIGQKIKQGLSLVIIGSPNVGKSSLINFLAQSEVAIVSDIAGTTRDIIDTHLEIAGMMVKISDTAGIRKTNNPIEKEGIERAIKRASEADFKVFVVELNNYQILTENSHLIDERSLIIINKIDNNHLGENLNLNDEEIINLKVNNWLQNLDNQSLRAMIIPVSIKENLNMNKFLQSLEIIIGKTFIIGSNVEMITQQRYINALQKALEALKNFDLNNNIEIAGEELRIASREIGKITGKVGVENILDNIFSKFCIGK